MFFKKTFANKTYLKQPSPLISATPPKQEPKSVPYLETTHHLHFAARLHHSSSEATKWYWQRKKQWFSRTWKLQLSMIWTNYIKLLNVWHISLYESRHILRWLNSYRNPVIFSDEQFPLRINRHILRWLGCPVTSITETKRIDIIFGFHETILSFGEPGSVGNDVAKLLNAWHIWLHLNGKNAGK